MTTRALAPSDAREVARLWHAGVMESAEINPAFRPRISVEDYAAQVEAELSTEQIFGWCVPSESTEGLVAYLTARIAQPSVEWEQDAYLFVLDVDVQGDQRRRGHARTLLALAKDHAKSLGITRLELCWFSDDPRSSAVWTKLGAKPYLQRGYLEL